MKNACLDCGADYDDEDQSEVIFHLDKHCQIQRFLLAPKEEPAKTGFHCRLCGTPSPPPSLLTGRSWCPPCQEYSMSDEDEDAPHADI